MPGGLQQLKKRIKSIKSTKQVTKAMEAVAASKMRKAVEKALVSRDYSSLGWQLINNLAQTADESMHPLLRKREKINKILLIFITSDKGLCGGLNSQIIRIMQQFLEDNKNKEIEVISIGKKGQHVLRKINKKIIGAYQGMAENPTMASLRPIVQTAIASFTDNIYDQVDIIFTDFKSALSQKPAFRQLLPLQKEGIENIVGPEKQQKSVINDMTEYIFEPNQKRLLDYLLPRLMEVQIYQAMLESTASEHSARMLAMRNATDSASEMIYDLTLSYNQIRQSSITQEIAEISAGRIALEN